jgi:predicted lipid-binding transport protein (Tim44 family)
MKSAFPTPFAVPLATLLLALPAFAQTPIYRCAGNVYTNNQPEALAKNCKLVEGGNVTVVQGTTVNGGKPAAPATRVATAPQAVSPNGSRIDAGEQKARDGEAREILEAELKKAEARLADLQKEFNGGEPEKLGPEHRNNQKYLDRVAELKANIERAERDVAGLKRELGRGSGTAAR